MGFIKNIIGLFSRKSDGESVIEFDEEGKALYKQDIISKVNEELEKRKDERQFLENQWRLNANFLVGNQYCEFNRYRGQIEQLEPVRDWEERDVFNQIAPLIETRIANLKKINYKMKVKPNSNELDDYQKAEVSTTLLQYIQASTDFEAKKNTAIYWSELCGNVFWLSWWDSLKGEVYAVEVEIGTDEKGNEYTKETPYYEGDLDYGLLTPYEVYPESVFKQGVENQRSIILEQAKTVDEIYDLYGVKVEGTSIDTFEITPVTGGLGYGFEGTVMGIGTRTVEDSQKVITYLERPSRRNREGKMIIIIADELIYYGPLPYGRIPLIQQQCYEVPGQFFGRSAIENLIPLQREYNSCVNRIHEYIKRIAIQQYAVEKGSIDIEEYEEEGGAPGYLMVYENGYHAPIPIPNSSLPGEILQERYNLRSDMEYAAGVSQLMVTGNAPQTNMSGTAISNLKEIDNTRLSMTGDHVRNAVKNLAKLWLEIYKQYATTKRVMNCVGKNNIGNVLVWSGKDITSFDVEYTTENELIMSEDMQKQTFFDAYKMGMFTDENGVIPARVKLYGIEFMKLGQYSELLNLNLLQMQAAQRENSFFENGVLPKVSELDNHNVHIEEHMRYALQMDFYMLKQKKPDYAAAFEAHIKEHKAILEQEQQKEMMMQGMGMLPAQTGGM